MISRALVLVRAAGLALALALPCAAHAGPRYAVVIGADRGDADETPLRYAERDARKVGDVLVRLGGVRPEDVLTLLTPTAHDLDRALGAFRARIELRDDDDAMVIVYYSGHADERALHLDGTRYAFDRFKAEVRSLGASLSIIVVDACRSGGLMRAKGVTPTEPFAFDVRDELATEGLAIITSSAADEDALESERLEGGVFTHHLVTGLLGAADRTGDERVTLAEVYRYAYDQTLAATSQTRVVQHPTYAFDVSGRAEVVLTQLATDGRRGRLRLVEGGHYLVFTQAGEVIAELDARAGTELSLAPGDYLVRRRDPSAVYERTIDIPAGTPTELAPASLVRVPYRSAVRKGMSRSERALSLGLALEVTSPILDETGTIVAAALGAQLDLPALALQLRLRYGHGSARHARVAFEEHVLGLDVGVFHLFDVGPHGLGFGVRGGVDWLAQRFETDGVAPDVDQLIGRVGPFARLELALGGVLTLTLDAGVEVYFIDAAHLDGGSALAAHAILTSALGLSVALP